MSGIPMLVLLDPLVTAHIAAAGRATRSRASARDLRQDLANLDGLRNAVAAGDERATWFYLFSHYEHALRPAHRPDETDLPPNLVIALARITGRPRLVVDPRFASYIMPKIAEAFRTLLQRVWLRLVGHLRATLRLVLIHVLGALSRRPAALNFVLALLAASRCYGHRSEPSDHALPALTSMLAVTGEVARSM